MMRKYTSLLIILCDIGLILVISYLGYEFSVSDKNAIFYDDSAIYFIQSIRLGALAPADVIELYTESQSRYLPYGLSIVMWLFDINADYRAAHILILCQYILVVVMVLLWYKKEVGRFAGFVLTLAVFSIPIFWIELLKIMAEYQYMLFMYLFILLYDEDRKFTESKTELLIFGFIVACLISTRTIGISLLLAFVVSRIRRASMHKDLYFYISIFTTYYLIYILSDSKVSGGYSYVINIIQMFHGGSIFETLFNILSVNAGSIVEAYKKLFTLFDINAVTISMLLNSMLIISFIGWLADKTKIYNTYLMIYVVVILLWPYASEMTRFLMPILPIIILNVISGTRFLWGISGFAYKKYKNAMLLVISLLLISVTLPVYALVYERYKIAESFYDKNIQYSPVLYVTEDAFLAFSSALLSDIYGDFLDRLPQYVEEGSVVMYAKPEIIGFGGGVRSIRQPNYFSEDDLKDFVRNILESKATHILVTGLTYSGDRLGARVYDVLETRTSIVHTEISPITNKKILLLLRLK